MEKYRQQILVGVVLVVAIAFGILVYMQFSGRSDLDDARGDLVRRAQKLRQSAEETDEGGFDTGTFSAIPAGPIGVDDVVSGIEDDVEFEDDLLDEQATEATDALSEEDGDLNEYDDVYEADAF